VTAEALRIDPSCLLRVPLGRECAHVDAGRAHEALVTVRRRIDDVTASAGKLNSHDATVFSKWLAATGDPTGALDMLGAKAAGEHPFAAERAITRALAHLALGDATAAAAVLPSSAVAREEDEYWRWIEAYDGVVRAGARANT
jgi:hypothetical protein